MPNQGAQAYQTEDVWEPLSRIGQAIAGPRLLAAEQGLYLPAQLLARRLLRPWPAPRLHPWQCCGAQGGVRGLQGW